MGKTKKKKSVIKKPIQIPLRNPIQNPIIQNPIYYPMPQYYQLKTKKMRKKDFIYTIGNSFKPREFMETPKKKINFSKTDNINKFVGNVLDLYNIDHNPEFLNFSINNFHNKITSYINILNNDHYLESINNVKNNSEVLELQKVLNEHELHLILETLDLLLTNAKQNKRQFSKNIQTNMSKNIQTNMSKNIQTNMSKISQKGGGPADIAKYDIFAFLNGDKRNKIKGRICDIIYKEEKKKTTAEDTEDTDEDTAKKKYIQKLKNDESMDVCFNYYLQTEIKKKQEKQAKIEKPVNCTKKHIKAFKKHFNETDFKPEKKAILMELIDTFNEIQIEDTVLARSKEKRMKEYLANISFVAMMGGLLPPEFFGEDMDYNPFDVLSTVICVFEGSTVCAVMSALPLFSPIMDGLSTFSTVRKIIQRFGGTGKMGQRSGAAMKKAHQVKIDKLKKQQETITQLQTNISKASKNLKNNPNAKQQKEILANLKKWTKENEKLTDIVQKAATKQKNLKTINAKKYLDKGIDDLLKKINNKEPLNSADKLQLTKIQEYATLKIKPLDEILGKKLKLTPKELLTFNKIVKESPELESIIKLGKRNGNFSVKGDLLAKKAADDAVKAAAETAEAVKTGKGTDQYDTVAQNFEDAEEFMNLANIAKGGSAEIVAGTPAYKNLKNFFGKEKFKTMIRPGGKMNFSKIEADEIFKYSQKLKGGKVDDFLSNQINVATKQLEMMKSGSFGLDEASYLEKHFKLYASSDLAKKAEEAKALAASSKASEAAVKAKKATAKAKQATVKAEQATVKAEQATVKVAETKKALEAAQSKEAIATVKATQATEKVTNATVKVAETKKAVAAAKSKEAIATSKKATSEGTKTAKEAVATSKKAVSEAKNAVSEANKAAKKAVSEAKKAREARVATAEAKVAAEVAVEAKVAAVAAEKAKKAAAEVTAAAEKATTTATKAAAEAESAAKLKSVAGQLDYVKEVKPLIDPLDELQQILDTTASAYLIHYNAQEEIEAIADEKLDEQYNKMNETMFSTLISPKTTSALTTLGSLLLPKGSGDLTTILTGLGHAKEIFKPSDCDSITNTKEKAECLKTRKNELIIGKGRKGIKERKEKFMYETDGQYSFNVKTKKNNLKEFGNRSTNKTFNEKKEDYLHTQMKKNIGENMFSLNKNTTPDISTIIEDEKKKRELESLEENSLAGGGKKSITMRNEIFNDSDLSLQLDKFNTKFKSRMIEFNEPLQQMMRKRSQYRIKQKSNLKDEHLNIYRSMKNKIEGNVEVVKTLEFELFEKMNNTFQKNKEKFFKNMSLLSKNSFMRNTIEIGTYYETKKLLDLYEGVEAKINKLTEDPKIKKFKDSYDKILTEIVIQEMKLDKVKQDIQDFKAKDIDLDKEKLILKNLTIKRDTYKAKTTNETQYSKLVIELKKLQKQLDATQVFIEYGKKINKKKLSIESFTRNKSAIFDGFKSKIIDEIDFIKNEYDIAIFLSLNIPSIKKLDLIKLLQGIYLDIARLKESFILVNKNYKQENLKLNKELESGKKQLKFYYENLSKIKLKKDKIFFNKRFKNRERNLKLLIQTHSNIISEYFANLNFIDKCKDLLIFCDFQINTIKNTNIMRETKSLLLSEKIGIIDITELHETQDNIKIKTNEKELIQIFNNILKYKNKINKTKKSIYKSITNKEIKLSKLKKEATFLKLSKLGNPDNKEKKTKKINKQIKVVNKRLLDYTLTNFGYLNFDNPLNIFVLNGILNSNIQDGKELYEFNTTKLKSLDIGLSVSLKDKLKEINNFIITEEVV